MPEGNSPSNPSRIKVLLAFGAVYIIWGSTFLAIRYAVETLPPLLMAGVRFLIAGTFLYVLMRRRGEPSPTRRHWVTAAVLGALLLLGGNGGLCWAEQRVPSGLAALLLTTNPIWMVLFDSLRKNGTKLNVRLVGGMSISISGLMLLIGPAHLWGSTRVDLLGAGFLLASSLCWSIGSVLSHKMSLPSSPFMAAAAEMLTGGAWLVLSGILTGEIGRFNYHQVALRSVMGTAYLVVAGSLLGFTAYIWLLHNVPTARVSTYAFVNPTVAVFIGWAIGGEALNIRELLATVTIIIGVVLIITDRMSPVAVAPDTEGLPFEQGKNQGAHPARGPYNPGK